MENLSKIHGQIEHITFSNEENGLTIAKMKIPGEKELVTVVGKIPSFLTSSSPVQSFP